MKNWEDIKVAYKVALLGTITAAAEDLGVHRATIIRHINSLEEGLGKKLFIRHASGYTPTESGKLLLRVAKVTDDQFRQLSNKLKDGKSSISGELIITSIDFLGWLAVDLISQLSAVHRDVRTHYIGSTAILRLDYGEAHIAIRVGEKPVARDNVVLPMQYYQLGLYASKKYITRYGAPQSLSDFIEHRFVMRAAAPTFPVKGRGDIEFEVWLLQLIEERSIVFKARGPQDGDFAIEQGMGIGFYPNRKAKVDKTLIEVWPREVNWGFPMWAVIHTDMFNTDIVQAFLDILVSDGILTSKVP